MVSSMRIFHQSSETLKLLMKVGLQTTPRVRLVEVSGFRSGFEPEVNGVGVAATEPSVGWLRLSSWRKLATSAMSRAQRARTSALLRAEPYLLSHGSEKLAKVSEPPPYRSEMVGARKPWAQVPRTSSWSIGFHLKPNLLLRVLPKVL
ncbi:hypothetical protein D3C73_1337850 [compost metagenome]